MWLLTAFAWWVRYHPPGMQLLVFDDDARQHVYWTARCQDPTLFADDLLTDFIVSSGFEPPGYRLLYRLGTRLLAPLPLSQLLSLLLLLLSLWLLYRLTGLIIPAAAGRLLCCGLFLFYSLYQSSGGFPRSFAFPLLLAFLLLWQKGAFRRAATTMPLAALFYPPVFLNIMVLALWAFVSGAIRRVEPRKRKLDFLALVIAMLLAGASLFTTYAGQKRNLWGERVTLEQARSMPEFHADGRSAFFRDSPASYFLLGRSGIGGLHLAGFVIIFVLMASVAGIRGMRVPAVSLHLLWSSLLLFAAAHLLLFRLHLPSRYTVYSLPLVFMLAIGASMEGFSAAVHTASNRLVAEGWRLCGLKGRRWTALILVLVAYAYLQGHYICRHDPQVVCLDRQDLEMLHFLEGLPKTAMVAGHPLDMDNVPLIARRRVLANSELSLPYYLGYYRQVRSRTVAMLQAYYATTWKEVENFLGRYGVDTVVVRKADFVRPPVGKRLYFEPFKRIIEGRFQAGHFALAHPPGRLRSFENQRYLVLCRGHEKGCRRWRQLTTKFR